MIRFPQRGFTLIELLIAMALLAFLFTLAGPMYSEFIANSNIRTAAETSFDGVRLAQQQAVKLNLPARFVLTPTQWTAEFTDEDNPTTYLVLQTYKFSEGASKALVTAHPIGATQVTFNGFGRVIPNADATASISWLEVTYNPPTSGTRILNVVIHAIDSAQTTFTGMKLCDPDAGIATSDPRHCPALTP